MTSKNLDNIISEIAKMQMQQVCDSAISECLTDELLAAFIDGNCSSKEYKKVIKHLSDCNDCLTILCSSVYWQENSKVTECGINQSTKSFFDYIQIPLLGSVPCGAPVEVFSDVEKMIAIPKDFVKPAYKYFLLRAHGDSMDKLNIKDGNLVLIRQQITANNGEIAAVSINGESTLKEYHNKGSAIILKSKSTNSDNKDIVLKEDFQIHGVAVKDENGKIVVLKMH